MRLVFIYGLPATGKLTVARELSRITGYPVFHNHLAVDLLWSVFEFGSKPFVELREEIWLSVFRQAAENQLPGLIFTFAPEPTVRAGFIPEAMKILAAYDSSVEFVELTCPVEELRNRIPDPSRRQFRKLSSVALFDQLHAGGSLRALEMPNPRLSIDTSACTPARTALEIARTLAIPF
jgi:chloramphenicol 3-O-phosphotransferase